MQSVLLPIKLFRCRLSHIRRISSDVDLKNIEIFRKQWKEWDDVDGVFKGLHSMNPLRVKWILSCLNETGFEKEKCRLLDIGCGGGLLSNALSNLGYNVTAIDPVVESLETKQQEKLRTGTKRGKLVNFMNCTLEELADDCTSDDKKFDAVIASEVIEHVPDYRKFISTIANTMKPESSHVFITTINRTFASLILAKIIGEYVIGVVPKGAHKWQMFVTPEEIKKEFAKGSIVKTDVRGLIYNPFKNEWSFSDKLTSVNFAIHGQRSSQTI